LLLQADRSTLSDGRGRSPTHLLPLVLIPSDSTQSNRMRLFLCPPDHDNPRHRSPLPLVCFAAFAGSVLAIVGNLLFCSALLCSVLTLLSHDLNAITRRDHICRNVFMKVLQLQRAVSRKRLTMLSMDTSSCEAVTVMDGLCLNKAIC